MVGLTVVHEDYARVDGIRLFYRKISPKALTPDAPVIVFLHQGLGCTAMWKDFPEKMSVAAGAVVLVYDRLGYGKSESVAAPRDLDFLRHEADIILPGLLHSLNISQPVCLYGHSDGATIALLASALHPQRVQAVVAEAPHVVIEEVTTEGLNTVNKLWINGELRESLQKYHAENTVSMVESWLEVWLQPGAGEWDIINELRAIKSPVLFIQGEDDNFGTIRQMEIIRSHTNGPFEQLLIPACGHIPHFQAPETVLERTVRFLGQYCNR